MRYPGLLNGFRHNSRQWPLKKCKALICKIQVSVRCCTKRAHRRPGVNFFQLWLVMFLFSVIVNYNTKSLTPTCGASGGSISSGTHLMDTKILPHINGIVGVALLVLFAAAIIAGQAGAKTALDTVPATERHLPDPVTKRSGRPDLVQVEMLQTVTDIVSALPVRVEINVDGNRILFHNPSPTVRDYAGQ